MGVYGNDNYRSLSNMFKLKFKFFPLNGFREEDFLFLSLLTYTLNVGVIPSRC